MDRLDTGESEYTFEPVDGGKVTLVGEAELGGFFKLAKPIVTRAIKRQGAGNLAGLKDLLEARAEVSESRPGATSSCLVE